MAMEQRTIEADFIVIGAGSAGCAVAARRDPMDYAIQEIGFVRVQQTGTALVVEFQPTTARELAVVAAFYEIAERAPETIVLVCRGEPDGFEIFRNPGRAFRRIEALIKRNP